MNTKPLIVTCIVGNEEIQILLDPVYPGSNNYYIFIDKENQGMVQNVTGQWIVGFIENSVLTDMHRDAILRAVSNAEYLNNNSIKK